MVMVRETIEETLAKYVLAIFEIQDKKGRDLNHRVCQLHSMYFFFYSPLNSPSNDIVWLETMVYNIPHGFPD